MQGSHCHQSHRIDIELSEPFGGVSERAGERDVCVCVCINR